MNNIKLESLLEKCWYGTIAYIDNEKKIELLERYIIKNKSILSHFQGYIISTNYSEGLDNKIKEKWCDVWRNLFKNKSLVFNNNQINRGHHFGTADLDDFIIEYCQNNKIKWLCKTSVDIIIENNILDKEVPEVDLYYLNGIGMGNLTHYREGNILNYNRIINEDFFPQTNFYILNVSKIDYIYDFNTIDFHFEEYKSGRQHNIFVGWNCEDFLKQCINRNKLSKFHLLNEDTYKKLINYIWDYKIHDPSHKNIMLEGICHFHNPYSTIITI